MDFPARTAKSQVSSRIWDEPRLTPGSVPCNICRQKIHSKWVVWSPTGAVTCNANQCVAFAQTVNGWSRYFAGAIPLHKPFPRRVPARTFVTRAPRRSRAERQVAERERLREQLEAARNTRRTLVTAPERRGWSCDRCGNRFPSRAIPVDVAGEQRCQDCL